MVMVGGKKWICVPMQREYWEESTIPNKGAAQSGKFGYQILYGSHTITAWFASVDQWHLSQHFGCTEAIINIKKKKDLKQKYQAYGTRYVKHLKGRETYKFAMWDIFICWGNTSQDRKGILNQEPTLRNGSWSSHRGYNLRRPFSLVFLKCTHSTTSDHLNFKNLRGC